ncbi:hypothetical protein GNP89_18305 [Aliivibrio fischeri]|uniref:hypothetical protein n=1 Tax=Aliivibrio fischeri TaxID=668 RepID=UPI0012D9D72A|nr:hypothetical protein [Aliivibrio fischeri]MUL04120.1 hypothetical protein [Aliivibrio fischeri]
MKVNNRVNNVQRNIEARQDIENKNKKNQAHVKKISSNNKGGSEKKKNYEHKDNEGLISLLKKEKEITSIRNLFSNSNHKTGINNTLNDGNQIVDRHKSASLNRITRELDKVDLPHNVTSLIHKLLEASDLAIMKKIISKDYTKLKLSEKNDVAKFIIRTDANVINKKKELVKYLLVTM